MFYLITTILSKICPLNVVLMIGLLMYLQLVQRMLQLSSLKSPYSPMMSSNLKDCTYRGQLVVFRKHRSYSIFVLSTSFWVTVSTPLRTTSLCLIFLVPSPSARASRCCLPIVNSDLFSNICVSMTV